MSLPESSVKSTRHSCWVRPWLRGGGLDVYPPDGDRAQEVGGVGQAEGDLTPIADRDAGADAGRSLDRGRVDAAVHDPPRGVVLRAQLQVAGNSGRGDFIEDEASGAQERAGILQRDLEAWRSRGQGRGGGGLRVHRTFLLVEIHTVGRAFCPVTRG